MINPAIILDYSTTLSQPDIINQHFVITGSSLSSEPVAINLTSDLVLYSASSLFSSTSGYWVFNGNGHAITVEGVTDFQGLFSSINDGGVVKNLAINSLGSTLAVDQTMTVLTGAIAGTSAGRIEHVSSNFDIGHNNGGIVGQMSVTGVVENSFSTGSIGINAGGIVGPVNFGSVINSYSTGAISGQYAGGIAGYFNAGVITNSYSTGVISGEDAGGIAGDANGCLNSSVVITNSYSTGAISGIGAGGIVGGWQNLGPIINSYSTGVISANAAGGITGINSNTSIINGAIIDSYSTGAGWSDTTAIATLTGLTGNPVWTDPSSNTTTPFHLASQPGFTVTALLSDVSPWAGNDLRIRIADPTLNNGVSFYADQAATDGFNENSNNLFTASYQWSADGLVIDGANSSTFKLSGASIGKAITAQVIYTNGLGVVGTGYVESISSATVDGVYDIAANVSTYLDAIEANHTTISNALATTGQFLIYDADPDHPVNVTVTQLSSAVNAISLIKSRTDYSGNPYLVAVADTAVNISFGIDALISNTLAGKIDDLLITDSGMVQINSSQLSSLASLAAYYGVNLTSSQFSDALVGLTGDGTLYIKASGQLTTCDLGSLVFFKDAFSNAGGIFDNCTKAPLFQSTGGVAGYTLPDLFTGPTSLGLKYQLIEDAVNAVVTGADSNEFIKVSNANSIGKAVNGNGGNDVIDGGVGSTFVTGGDNHNTTFFLDGRAPGTSWSTITDFQAGVDKATIWGFVKGVSSIDTSFTNYNNDGAAGYTGLTLHFKNLLPDGQTSGSNANLNSITFTGYTLQDLGVNSLAELNAQILAGTNANIIVGATQDSLGTHSYLYIH